MREMQCPCGITLTGADDTELVRRGREHADEHHPGDNISDDFIREHVATNARDAAVQNTSTAKAQ
jgi:predicted small metal-binding protein